jgi:predicted ABC-type ATPase
LKDAINWELKNLFDLYADKVDSLLIYDNSTIESELIAEKEFNTAFTIYQNEKFNQLKEIANEQ